MSATTSHPLDSGRDPSYGWVMVAAVFVLTTLSFGAFASISVFLKPLALEFGWTRGETAFGYTATSFASALFGIFWGIIADRFGTRWFGVVAAFAMAASLLLLSRQTSLYHFYGLYFFFGAFGSAMVTAPLVANVGFWFRRNPGLALGITAAGGAFVAPLCADGADPGARGAHGGVSARRRRRGRSVARRCGAGGLGRRDRHQARGGDDRGRHGRALVRPGARALSVSRRTGF